MADEPMCTWLTQMEAELQKGGAFLKMLPTDQKVVTIKSDPVQCKSNFVEYGKEPKNEFQIKVQIEGDQKEVTWSIGNRNVMSQLVALTKHHNLSSLVGAKLLLKTSGTDVKNRAWFIVILTAPGDPNKIGASTGSANCRSVLDSTA